MPELKNTEAPFMRRFLFTGRLLLVVVVLQLTTACSFLNKVFPDRSKEYKKAEPTRPLDVPPDLTTTPVTDALIVPSGSTTLSGYTGARETLAKGGGGASPVLPSQESLRFERERDRAWLVVQGEPAAVWPEAREFWLENGFFIMLEDPAVGILQTDWVENTEAIPEGLIRGLISRVIPNAYSSAFRDRYRMRLERGEESGTTEIFISHQGIQEVVTDENDGGTITWEPRPSDPGLESVMLKRMMIFLGVEPEQAKQLVAEKKAAPDRAELTQKDSEQAVLLLHENYSKAWRNVGIVLDRIDFAVEDRDRLQGLYYVRYNDPLKGREDKGLLSKLAFWSSNDDRQVEHLQIKLTDDGTNTRVVVLNSKGEHETSVTAVRILTLLFNELK